MYSDYIQNLIDTTQENRSIEEVSDCFSYQSII